MREYDIGIVIPLKEEWSYFKELASPSPVGTAHDCGAFQAFELKTAKSAGLRRLKCVATFAGDQVCGQRLAAATARALVQKFAPPVCVLIGIAGRIKDDLNLGDVVIPPKVTLHYENYKIWGDKLAEMDPDPEQRHASRRLVRASQNLSESGLPAWSTAKKFIEKERGQIIAKYGEFEIIRRYFNCNEFRYFNGAVASENYIAASDAASSDLLQYGRKQVAIENEGFGFLEELLEHIPSPEGLVIRGISDPGNADKNEIERLSKNSVRRFAMRNATRVFLALAKSGLLSPQVPSRVTVGTRRSPKYNRVPRQEISDDVASKFADIGGRNGNETPSRRAVVVSPVGTGIEWSMGLRFPAMQTAFEAAGSYFGSIAGDLIGQTDFALSLRARHFLAKQLRTDFRNSCLGSPSEASGAHKYSALLLERGGIMRASSLSEQSFASIDFRGSLGVTEHARMLRQGASHITISCPALFPAALSVCLALKDKLAANDIFLHVDSADPTSRSQVVSLSSNFSIDFAIMADPPLFMSSDSRRARDRFRLVLPCFWHEDAIVGSSAAIAGSSPSSSLIYFHAESTAELMLRTSVFGGDARYHKPIVDPSVASALRAALSAGHYVTTWEPLTSVLLNRFSDLVIIPNTRFKSYVSIFANRSWLSSARVRSLAAFLSLFSDQWHRMQARPNTGFIRKFDIGMERFGRISGLSDLHRYN